MTEPAAKAPKITPVRLVDEAYEPPENASPIEKRNGEIAQAKRMARADERAKLWPTINERASEISAVVKQSLQEAHAAELARQDQRWQREEAKHGSGKFWSGMATGLFVAGALVATGGVIAVNAIIGPTFDAAARARFDNQVVSTLTQEREPTTNQPRSESAP